MPNVALDFLVVLVVVVAKLENWREHYNTEQESKPNPCGNRRRTSQVAISALSSFGHRPDRIRPKHGYWFRRTYYTYQQSNGKKRQTGEGKTHIAFRSVSTEPKVVRVTEQKKD